MTHPVLTALGLSDNESGTYLGHGEWSTTRDAGVIEPINPSTGEVLARVQASSQADYDIILERAQAAFKVWRTTPAPQARRSHPPVRRRAAQAQGRARFAGRAGDGQDQARRRRRSAGDDRHRRFRRRPVAPAVRPDHAFRAPRPPHVRAVPAARPGRHHQRVQFPGRGVGLEQLPGRRLRRHLHLEAVAEDAAVGDRLAEDLQRSAEGRRLPGHLLPVQRRRHRAGAGLRRRQAHPADQLHRLHPRRPPGRRARRAAPGPLAARTRRQQRDHRRRERGHEAGDPGDRVRRGRHRRPALHHHAPRVRARIHLRQRARHAGQGLQAGRNEDRRPDPGRPR